MKIFAMIAITVTGGTLGALLGYFGKCTSGACPLTANPFRGAIVGLLIGALTAVSVAGPPSASTKEKDENGKEGDTVIHVKNKDEFKSRILADNTLALVDFYADWCPPCRKLSPILENFAKTSADTGLLVAKVNVDRHRDIAGQYKVRSIPHLVLIRDGKVIDQRGGLQTETSLAEWIKSHQEVD